MNNKGVPLLKVEFVRMMTDKQAATYLGMTVAQLKRDVAVIPRIMAQGQRRWDVNELDKWIDEPTESDAISVIDRMFNNGENQAQRV